MSSNPGLAQQPTGRAAVLGLVVVLAMALLAGTATAAVADEPVSDELGTRDAGVMEPLATTSDGDVSAQHHYCAPHFAYGGGFTTSLGAGWSELAARNEPCRAAPWQGSWYTGQTFFVYRETNGEFICRGRVTYGYGSSIWYQTSKGWSWSGGTSNPQWNASC